MEERLIRNSTINTQSDEASPSSPGTERQLVLLRMLVDELKDIGAADVLLTDYGVVLATIPAKVAEDLPAMGWLAHVDTAPGFAASGVKPVVHRGYDGGAIRFADAPDLIHQSCEPIYVMRYHGVKLCAAACRL